MSDLVVNDVRLAIRHLPAALHHKCDVPGKMSAKKLLDMLLPL